MVCTDAEESCHVSPIGDEASEIGGRIYRALKCELIPYNSEARISDSESRLLISMEKLLSSGTFFFPAPGDDLACRGLLHRCQERAVSVIESFTTLDSTFLWNRKLIQTLVPNLGDIEWLNLFVAPLMQGFALTRSFSEEGIKHTVSVISRRSTAQAGTRYNARGIDDDGNVAIFTETECIVTSSVGADGAELFSFVQIRGSVPVFWSQSNSLSVELTRNFEMTKSAFQRHIDWLRSRYNLVSDANSARGKLVFVNLLSGSKGGESLLSSALTNHIQHFSTESPSNRDSLMLVEFDFHKYVNSSRPLEDSLTNLMDVLRPYVYHFGYFEEHPGEVGIKSSQNGVFRVNCLDCLDRTNAVQMQIAWESVLLAKFASFPKSSPTFKELFTDVWVRNGDAISKGYSGTGSVLSRLVRTAGKGNQLATMIEHSWRSANRFIAANFDDHDRQVAISQLLRYPSRTLTNQPDERESISKLADLTIWVGTFNVHGRRIDEQRGVLHDLLTEPTDIVIACFQETIDLTAGSVLFATRGDDERNRIIDLQLLSALERISKGSEPYVQVANESLVGLYMTVFVKARLSSSIDAVKTRRFKAGFGGTAGNKGSVSVTLRLFKSVEIEIVNLHLDSGSDKAEERMEQLAFILDNASSHNRSLLSLPQSHHHRNRSRVVFLCGDFNFRCDGISPSLAVELVNKDRVEKLRSFDPFVSTATSDGNVLKTAGYKEMPLTFPPTYKYDIATGQLTDKRTPSWCDRIFFQSNFAQNLSLDPMYYNSIQSSRLSDHKPVIGFFAFRHSPVHGEEEDKMPDVSANESVESIRSAEGSGIFHSAIQPPVIESPPIIDLLALDSEPASSASAVPEPRPESPPKDDNELVDLLL